MNYANELKEWEKMLSELFPVAIPERAEWIGNDNIISVLDFIGKSNAYNHTFLPRSGGLDLGGANEANEEGLIELRLDNIAHLLKPSHLHFRSTSNIEWSYFYLETEEINYTEVYEDTVTIFPDEELVEISPGNYIERSYWDQGEYNGERLPKEARLIGRYIRGNFAIFSKASNYNRTSGTYDGRHDKMGFSKFEDYINRSLNKINK